MVWLYVPGLGGSSLEFPLPSLDTELWVTSNATLTRRPVSWRGWKNRPWIRRLSGTISQPSTAHHGVERWILSLQDSRASRSAQPVASEGSTTTAGCGPTSSESLARYSPDSSSWRTSTGLFEEGSELSPEDWPKWGSLRSGVISARPELERPTSVRDSSCSLPTPTAGDAKSSGSRNKEGSSAKEGTSLTDALVRGSSKTGRPQSAEGVCLNPQFVEWMMGLPFGWTDCDASGTAWFRVWRNAHTRP